MSEVKTIKTKDSITTGIDFSYDHLLTSHEDGYIRIWDVRNSITPAMTFKSHAKYASCAKFSKSSNIFASVIFNLFRELTIKLLKYGIADQYSPYKPYPPIMTKYFV